MVPISWTAPRTWTTGEVVTAAELNTDVRDNLAALFHQVALVQGGANTSVTTSNTTLLNAGSAGYLATSTFVEWQAGGASSAGNAVTVKLTEGTVTVGTMAIAAAGVDGFVSGFFSFTPTAGTHNYQLSAALGGGGPFTFSAPFFIRLSQQG